MGIIIFVHIVVCVLLVISILMQAGRGGGLAESFASAESMFGTQTNAFMVRLSTILAIIFFCTSLILAVSSSKGSKSLMAHAKLPASPAGGPAKTSASVKPETRQEPTVKVSEPQPISETKPLTNTAK